MFKSGIKTAKDINRSVKAIQQYLKTKSLKSKSLLIPLFSETIIMPGKLEENNEEIYIAAIQQSFKFKYPRGANVTANLEEVIDYESDEDDYVDLKMQIKS